MSLHFGGRRRWFEALRESEAQAVQEDRLRLFGADHAPDPQRAMRLRRQGQDDVGALFYIVPKAAAEKCAKCLKSQFSRDESIAMGLLTWEGLLPLIYDRLVETALDQVIREMEGLKHLRAWDASRVT